MPRHLNPRCCTSPARIVLRVLAVCLLFAAALRVAAQLPSDASPTPDASQPNKNAVSPRQARLEAAFAKMLSGATLEGSYTSTGDDSSKLSRDKYTLGEVRKSGGNRWLIQARIQYDQNDVTLPITVPIQWAGDTPVIIVDNLGIPPFGTVSARVMFFDGHYAGYWKHGPHGGHLFGVIRPGDEDEKEPSPPD